MIREEERAIKVLINVQSQFQASLDEVDVDKDCKEAEEDNTEIVTALEMAIRVLKQKSNREEENQRKNKKLVNKISDVAKKYPKTYSDKIYDAVTFEEGIAEVTQVGIRKGLELAINLIK